LPSTVVHARALLISALMTAERKSPIAPKQLTKQPRRQALRKR